MIKVKGDPIATKLERMATYAELQALRERVAALEARNVTPVTIRNAEPVTRNGKSNADRQRAYRERRKANGKET